MDGNGNISGIAQGIGLQEVFYANLLQQCLLPFIGIGTPLKNIFLIFLYYVILFILVYYIYCEIIYFLKSKQSKHIHLHTDGEKNK